MIDSGSPAAEFKAQQRGDRLLDCYGSEATSPRCFSWACAVNTIRILLFAAAADAIGSTTLDLEMDSGGSVAELLDRLALAHPAAESLLRKSAAAVNEKYARPTTRIQPGDTVAIIPPVSGG